VIYTGDRTCKCTGHNGKREKGSVGKPDFYVVVYKKGGKQKVGFLEDTLMSEKEARGRADACGKQTRRRQTVPPVPLPLAPKLQAP
jgi:hypothetical protein